MSTSISEVGHVFKESVRFAFEASPKIAGFRSALALGQSVQMFVYGKLGSALFVGLSNSHNVSDPKLWIPAVGMLAFKATMDYLSSHSQSLDPMHQASTQEHIQKTLRSVLPGSLERMKDPVISKDAQKVSWGIWGLSNGGNQLVQSVGAAGSMLIGAGLLAVYAPPAVSICVAASLVYPIVKGVVLGKLAAKHEEEMADKKVVLQDLSWKRVSPFFARVLNSIGASDALEKQTAQARGAVTEGEQKFAGAVVKHEAISNLVRFGSTVFAFGYLGSAALKGALPLQDAIFVGMSAVPLIQGSLDQFSSACMNIIKAKPVVDALKRLRVLKQDEMAGVGDAAIDWKKGVPEVKLANINFAYPPQSEVEAAVPLLEDLNLTIRAGETVAVVGDNGAGKSTLLQLIDRSLTPLAGEIKIGDAPISKVTAQNLFEGMSVHLQSPQQMGRATFREFLSWGRAQGNENPELLDRAMKASGLKEILEKEIDGKDGKKHRAFPKGLDTVMGREYGGIDPSGGELGMLYTTYMLYKEPKLMCLDEPTSGLSKPRADAYYDMLFKIEEVLGYKPTIAIVTHDPERAKRADRVAFLSKDSKGVADYGTHAELMARGGPYADWYKKSVPAATSNSAS